MKSMKGEMIFIILALQANVWKIASVACKARTDDVVVSGLHHCEVSTTPEFPRFHLIPWPHCSPPPETMSPVQHHSTSSVTSTWTWAVLQLPGSWSVTSLCSTTGPSLQCSSRVTSTHVSMICSTLSSCLYVQSFFKCQEHQERKVCIYLRLIVS